MRHASPGAPREHRARPREAPGNRRGPRYDRRVSDPTTGPSESRDLGKPFAWSAGPRDAGSIWDTRGQAPLHDPFLHAPAPPPKRSPWLAIVAITSTLLFLGTAGLAAWLWLQPRPVPLVGPSPQSTGAPDPGDPTDPSAPAPPRLAPAPGTSSAAADSVPRQTKVAQVGKIEVVDLGVDSQRSLKDLLSEQRTAAKAAGQTLLLMTTRYGTPLFNDVDRSLPDPLLQQALASVRLVRADVRFFEVELDDMGVPTDSFPWFVLLGPDLVPRDGINGGEWGDDVPANIAPVLGPFVRGTYRQRRETWKPPPSKGVQL
jgi:hypothetical protein